MTDRITKTKLRGRVDMLNRLFGYEDDATPRYTLDIAYGGYRLAFISGPGGGERDLTPRGNARQTYDAIAAFEAGAQAMLDKIMPRWRVEYEVRERGAQGVFEKRAFFVRGSDRGHAQQVAFDEAQAEGLETRFPGYVEAMA